MQNEHSSTAYFDACMHANNVLGDDATKRYAELRKLSRSGFSLTELRREVDRWAPAPAPPKPTPAPRGLAEPWVPCAHHGLVEGRPFRLCHTCLRELEEVKRTTAAVQTAADATGSPALQTVAGSMRRAQTIFEDHRPLVWKMLHEQLKKYTQLRGDAYDSLFEDVEQEIWTKIGEAISGYRGSIDRGSKLLAGWLRTVVRSVTNDYFSYRFAKKRDVRLTTSYSEYLAGVKAPYAGTPKAPNPDQLKYDGSGSVFTSLDDGA